MKNVMMIAMLLLSQMLMAVEKKVKSDIKNVTVFTQGAQVFRTATVSLQPGITEVVFTGLSSTLNPASVQAGGKGNFIVLDVRHNIQYPQPAPPVESKLPAPILNEISLLEDSLSEITFTSQELQEQKNALVMEKEMITKNKLSRGEGKSDSLPVLKQAMEFFRIKLTDINSQLAKIARTEQKLQKSSQRIQERLQDLRTYKTVTEPAKPYQPEHQLIVTVSADAATNGTVEVSYMVANAGWVPTYDLRATSITAPIKLTYKANVYQQTGENWEDVKLKLSTSNPNKGNTKPTLPIWYINYFTQYQNELKIATGARESIAGNNTNNDVRFPSKSKDEESDAYKKLSPAQSAANYSQLVETMTNVEFNISLSYNIPSDGANHMVSVQTSELPSAYYHYLVPKMDSEAFLVAKIAGWESLNLLPGRANVFYEGTFVGETSLNPSVINDTLQLALGRDNGIVVTRTKKPVKDHNRMLSSTITKSVAYELKIKNNKAKMLTLVVEDQIPVSQNKEIKVELTEQSNAEYNITTGMLKWNVDVNSHEWRTIKFAYDVTYDKDKAVSLY